MSGLKVAVAGLGLNGGVTNALTRKLDEAASLPSKGQRTEAVDVFRDAFIGQVNDLAAEGKLTAGQAATLVAASQQLILNINTSS